MESGFSFSDTVQQCKLGMILFLYRYSLVSTMPLMTHNLKLCKPNRNTTPSVFVLFILCLKSMQCGKPNSSRSWWQKNTIPEFHLFLTVKLLNQQSKNIKMNVRLTRPVITSPKHTPT